MRYPLSNCRIMATELNNQLLSTIQSMSSSQMSNCRNVDSQRRRNVNWRQEDLCQLSPSADEDGIALVAAVDPSGRKFYKRFDAEKFGGHIVHWIT